MKRRCFPLILVSMCFSLYGIVPTIASATLNAHSAVFDEIVEIVQTHFYKPEQIAKTFPAIAAEHRKRLPRVTGRKAFSKLVNAMLGKLNASHTYYLTPDDPEYYQLGDLFFEIPEIRALFNGQDVRYPSVGVLTQTIRGKVHIVSVLPGSAAENAGLLKGDEIVSVNGKPYTPIAALRPIVGADATFKIRRRRHAKPLNIVARPSLVNPTQAFLAAQKASIRLIERGGKRIGYIHLYSYTGDDFHKQLLDALMFGALKAADALIIDLRYGMGGAWPYYLNLFNRQVPIMTMRDRDGKETTMDSQWRKPAVYLVNGFSRSGKELLAFGARKYHLATVIGERTPGKVLGGRLFPLSNGDALFLAINSSRIDGVNLEGVGVAPDIEVPFDVRYCAGHDKQLERSVDHLVEVLPGKVATTFRLNSTLPNPRSLMRISQEQRSRPLKRWLYSAE
jgi:carboxyl-terminal processing protease